MSILMSGRGAPGVQRGEMDGLRKRQPIDLYLPLSDFEWKPGSFILSW